MNVALISILKDCVRPGRLKCNLPGKVEERKLVAETNVDKRASRASTDKSLPLIRLKAVQDETREVRNVVTPDSVFAPDG